jgi:biopolymer transport protein ExbD
MSTAWKVRHEGSPASIDDLTLQQVLEGLADGLWEGTDEVMGPGETEWVAIENHPQLAEAAADLEPPPPRTYDDETRLDMNALIDVTMVLLIFFILTTSYAAMQKLLEAPTAEKGPKTPVATLTEKDRSSSILVSAKLEGGKPVVRVEGKEVDPARLTAELRGLAGGADKHALLLEHDDDVSQELVVKIIDDAKGAGLSRVRLVVP